LLLADAMDPLTEALLLFAGRRDHLVQTIEPALARGAVVLSDRFTDATFAYQGNGRGFDAAVLRELEGWVQRVPAAAGALRQPDLTFWFDLAPEFAAMRLAHARDADRFEAESVEFFRRVAAGYAARAAAEPGRFVRLDAAQSPAHVWQQLSDALRARGWLGAATPPRSPAP
ncbi:MAG: dTMP kinase, partial [Burkholderiales bacterium]